MCPCNHSSYSNYMYMYSQLRYHLSGDAHPITIWHSYTMKHLAYYELSKHIHVHLHLHVNMYISMKMYHFSTTSTHYMYLIKKCPYMYTSGQLVTTCGCFQYCHVWIQSMEQTVDKHTDTTCMCPNTTSHTRIHIYMHIHVDHTHTYKQKHSTQSWLHTLTWLYQSPTC